jgi:sugar phosphate isomerase/epimerase
MFKNLSAGALGISGGPSEMIEPALSFGFKGLELNVVDFSAQVKTHGLPHSRRLLDSAKLKLSFFRLPVDWQNDDETFQQDMERLPSLAGLAAELGCTRALVWVAPASNDRHFHQNFEFHRQRFAEIAKRLDPLGIRLGIGFQAAVDLRQGLAYEFVRSLDALLMLLSVVQAKNVGLVLDEWDLFAGGGSLDSLQKVSADKIVAVQLADAAADAAEHNWPSTARLLPLETGVIDSSATLAWLAERGYDGPVTPVPSTTRSKGMSRDGIVKLAGAQLDKAWKTAGLNPAVKLATSTARR